MRTAILLSLLFVGAFCSQAGLPWSKRLGDSWNTPKTGLIRRHINLRSPWHENSDRSPILRKTQQKAVKTVAEKKADRKSRKPHTTRAPDIHIGHDDRNDEPLADKEPPKSDPNQNIFPKDEPRDDGPLSDKPKNKISTFGPVKRTNKISTFGPSKKWSHGRVKITGSKKNQSVKQNKGPTNKPKKRPTRMFLGQKRSVEDQEEEPLAELNTFMAAAVEAYNRPVENVNNGGKKKATKKKPACTKNPRKSGRILARDEKNLPKNQRRPPAIRRVLTMTRRSNDEELSEKQYRGVYTGVTVPKNQNKGEALRVDNVSMMRVNPRGASQDEEDLSDFPRLKLMKRPVVHERYPRMVEQLSDINTFLNSGVDYALNRAVESTENSGKKKAKKTKKSKKAKTLSDKKSTGYTLKPSRKPAIIGSLSDLTIKKMFRAKLEKIHDELNPNGYLMALRYGRADEEQLSEQELAQPIRRKRATLTRAQGLHGIRTPTSIRLHKNPFIGGGSVGDDYEPPLRSLSEQRDIVAKKNFNLKNTQEPFGVLSDKKKKKNNNLSGIEKENMNVRNPNSPFDIEIQTGSSTLLTTKNSNSPFEQESDHYKAKLSQMKLRNPRSPYETESDKNKKNKWSEQKGGKRNVKHF